MRHEVIEVKKTTREERSDCNDLDIEAQLEKTVGAIALYNSNLGPLTETAVVQDSPDTVEGQIKVS